MYIPKQNEFPQEATIRSRFSKHISHSILKRRYFQLPTQKYLDNKSLGIRILRANVFSALVNIFDIL